MADETKQTNRNSVTTAEFDPSAEGRDTGQDLENTRQYVFQLNEEALSKKHALIVIYGSNIGKTFDIEPGEQVIGRDEACDISLFEREVSRRHCQLVVDEGGARVVDLGSTNGTYINDERIEQKDLENGDRLRVGCTMLKYLKQGNVEKHYHDEIINRTNVDALTQAYNRRYLLSVLHREIGRSIRHHRELSLIMLDIDHFKQINDIFGHLAGDRVLIDIVTTIQSNIRREDVLTRFGGEEFIVVLPETPYTNAFVCAEKLRKLVEDEKYHHENVGIPVTVSLGVVTCDDGNTGAMELIDAADSALYEAKRLGRNRVCGAKNWES